MPDAGPGQPTPAARGFLSRQWRFAAASDVPGLAHIPEPALRQPIRIQRNLVRVGCRWGNVPGFRRGVVAL